MNTPIAAAILAGGKSRRMGFDKAQAERDGETFLARTVRVAREAGLESFVVGRERPVEWRIEGVSFIPDRWPDHGPLGGIATALMHAERPVLALACDMPGLCAPTLRWLLDVAADHPPGYGVIVQSEGGYEPLFSVYTPECLPILQERLAGGDLSLQSVIRNPGFAITAAPGWVKRQLVNINTPEELAALAAEEGRHG